MEERLHLKGLNGLRAIAAISVVVAHIHLNRFQYNYLWPQELGTYSVTVFFTLSGFLITYLLLTEKCGSTIRIRNFYIRRVLRIWPLYFAYLFIAVTITCFQAPEKLPGLLPYYLFFAANVPNILSTSLPFLGHYWSLGVEEQFYLFWPWLIKKPGNTLKGILIFLVIFYILKLVARFLYLRYGFFIPINAFHHTRFECMAIGGVGAYFCFKQHQLFFRIAANKFTELVCWLCLCLVAASKYRITPLLNHDIISLITVGIIVNLSFNKNPLIRLENRLFGFLGRISYGIYVIHPMIIIGLQQLLNRFHLSQPTETGIFFFGVLLLTISMAWVSYVFFEKKFLRLKDRYSVVKSSG